MDWRINALLIDSKIGKPPLEEGNEFSVWQWIDHIRQQTELDNGWQDVVALHLLVHLALAPLS
jgi:hypothetical protein